MILFKIEMIVNELDNKTKPIRSTKLFKNIKYQKSVSISFC